MKPHGPEVLRNLAAARSTLFLNLAAAEMQLGDYLMAKNSSTEALNHTEHEETQAKVGRGVGGQVGDGQVGDGGWALGRRDGSKGWEGGFGMGKWVENGSWEERERASFKIPVGVLCLVGRHLIP